MEETHSFLRPVRPLVLLLCIRCCERCGEEGTDAEKKRHRPQFLGDRVSTRDMADSKDRRPKAFWSSSLLQGRAGALPVSAERYLDEGWSPAGGEHMNESANGCVP